MPPTDAPEPWKVALAEALDFVVFPPDWTRKERAAGLLDLISRHHDSSCPGPTPTRTERAVVLDTLAEEVGKFPHLRICQLIVNATGRNDPFYVEDETLVEALREYGRKALEVKP